MGRRWLHHPTNGNHFSNKTFISRATTLVAIRRRTRSLNGRVVFNKVTVGTFSSYRRGSRIFKWGVNFCNNVLEPINIWGIRKKEKEEGSEKGGWKFTRFTSPGSAPELVLYRVYHLYVLLIRRYRRAWPGDATAITVVSGPSLPSEPFLSGFKVFRLLSLLFALSSWLNVCRGNLRQGYYLLPNFSLTKEEQEY